MGCLSCVHLGRLNNLYSMLGRFEKTDMLLGMCCKYCTLEGCQTSATLVLASAEICMRSMKRSVVVSRCGCGGGGSKLHFGYRQNKKCVCTHDSDAKENYHSR